YGINRIFSPEDGRQLGLQGMINSILEGADFSTALADPCAELERMKTGDVGASRLARMITGLEPGCDRNDSLVTAVRAAEVPAVPVLGITGTGGAGKSSLTDELLARLLREHPERRIAVISVDPSRRRTGGALLGDRIRMNALRNPRVFMRSMATRKTGVELSNATDDAVRLCKLAGYDLVVVETSGIGQGDAEITRVADVTLYVMTAEYGAPSQLEKIEMLDVADFVAINKFEHKGSKDALRDVRKQLRRNRQLFQAADSDLGVFGTVASRFHDSGVNGLYTGICARLTQAGSAPWASQMPADQQALASDTRDMIPADRTRYLAEIVKTVRDYKARVHRQVEVVRQVEGLRRTRAELTRDRDAVVPEALAPFLDQRIASLEASIDGDARQAIEQLPAL
ncbi:MAG: ArgK/MeaB family GTPase, partial [Nannocystaceae bacterium]